MKTKTLVKKIETVTALQYLGEKNKYEVCEFFKGIKFTANFEKLPLLTIHIDGGYYELKPTDWLIKKADGDIEYLADDKMSDYFEESDVANTIVSLKDEIERLEDKLFEANENVKAAQDQNHYFKLMSEYRDKYEELKFRMDGLEK